MEKIEILSTKASETLTSIKNKLDSFISEDEALWMAVAMFLFGVIVGMLISPRKTKTVTIGSNNNAYDVDCDDDELCCEDDCCDCE